MSADAKKKRFHEMLIQLHQENKKTGEAKFCAQQDIRSAKDMDRFLADTKKEYTLPDGYGWIACKEGSSRFLLAAE